MLLSQIIFLTLSQISFIRAQHAGSAIFRRGLLGDDQGLEKRSEKKKICDNSDYEQFFPDCKTDADCITNGHCSLPLSNKLWLVDSFILHGSGYCKKNKECGCTLKGKSPEVMKSYCSDYITKYIPSAVVVAGCELADGDDNCDLVYPNDSNQSPKPITIPCATVEAASLPPDARKAGALGTKNRDEILSKYFKCPGPYGPF